MDSCSSIFILLHYHLSGCQTGFLHLSNSDTSCDVRSSQVFQAGTFLLPRGLECFFLTPHFTRKLILSLPDAGVLLGSSTPVLRLCVPFLASQPASFTFFVPFLGCVLVLRWLSCRGSHFSAATVLLFIASNTHGNSALGSSMFFHASHVSVRKHKGLPSL